MFIFSGSPFQGTHRLYSEYSQNFTHKSSTQFNNNIGDEATEKLFLANED